MTRASLIAGVRARRRAVVGSRRRDPAPIGSAAAGRALTDRTFLGASVLRASVLDESADLGPRVIDRGVAGRFPARRPTPCRGGGLAVTVFLAALVGCGPVELARDGGSAVGDAGASAGDGGAMRPDAGLADGSVVPSPDAGPQADAGPGVDAGLPPDAGPPPAFPHLDTVVDRERGSTPAWLELIHVRSPEAAPSFSRFAYADTSARHDFWPASTIKIYTATAALVLLEEYGLSLDTEATFYHRSGPTDAWVEDTRMSVRRMIFDVFDHSSNSTYTLLLRLAGLDWLNDTLFSEAHGFRETALMVGYVSDRPWRYSIGEEQRIVLEDGGRTVERTHVWSGTRYDDRAGCTTRYGTYANCSSPRDMAEHMRRLIFHEALPEAERFALRDADLEWMRRGDGEPVMNQADSPWAGGIRQALPRALYYHKAGRVSAFALDLHYVDDAATDTHYVAAIATESTTRAAYDAISEEIARMVLTPHAYVGLDSLRDNVNPVEAGLYVYATSAGTLDLIVKPYAEDGADPTGWSSLPGTTTRLEAGEHSVGLRSSCLDADARYHVRGRFVPDDGAAVATSDLHYVIVDADVACP